MADFFDTSKDEDLNLLHSSVRTHDEVDNVVNQVEWNILDHYSQREGQSWGNYDDFFEYEQGNDPTNEIKVRLVGYDSEDPTNSEADLQEALRRTIADVSSWVLRNYHRSQGVDEIQQGNRSYSSSSGVPSWREWPHGWQNKLSNFSAEIPAYGI